MELVIVLALVVAIPVILFPAAFVWYLNIGGLWTVWQERRVKKALRKAVLAQFGGGVVYLLRPHYYAVKRLDIELFMCYNNNEGYYEDYIWLWSIW